MLFFDRLLRRNVAPMKRPSGSVMPGCEPRPDSPVGASIFTTSAPRRASSCVAYGSACICSSASTRTPSSGFPYFAASSFATSPSRTVLPSWSVGSRVQGGADSRPDLTPRQNARRARYPERMRGIQSWSAYLPYRRLDRTQIAPFVGQGGGKGTRTVASFDEDSTTMGVEAARLALRGRDLVPAQLLFATTFPAYADRTNATAIHAALRLPDTDARVRLRRVGPRRRSARSCSRSRVGPIPRSSSPATCAPACPAAARRRRAATPPTAFVVGSDADRTGGRRARRFGERHRRVRRALAGAGRAAHQDLGREVQRDQLRAARRAGVERGARRGRPHRQRRRRRRGRRARASGWRARSAASSTAST